MKIGTVSGVEGRGEKRETESERVRRMDVCECENKAKV